MIMESKPCRPLPAHAGGIPYRVQDGDDWYSVARKHRVNVQALIMFNFGTLNTNEVNWYLRRNVGCVLPSPKGFNWSFSSTAKPGIIYIPPPSSIELSPIQLQQYTYAIATLSWIDPRTNLPEVDNGEPEDIIPRDAILANQGYRFANFLEATVTVTNTSLGRMMLPSMHVGYTKDSALYRAPSFLDYPSYAYPIKIFEPVFVEGGVEFRQTVGARTQSAELLARNIGGPLGAIGGAAAQYLAAFPPIWSDLKLTIRYDGTYTGEMLAYSLFPSLSYYENFMMPCFNMGAGSKLPCQGFEKKFGYNGMPNYDRWFHQKKGWGPQQPGPNPCEGNPWEATGPDPGAIFGEPQPDPNEVARRPTAYPPQSWLPGRQ
jgi:hypothetical protein